MPVPVPIRYPLDKTGLSPDNKIVGEPHDLVNRLVRAIAPNYGPFFTESLVVRDVTTGLTLRTPQQYVATEMDVAPTGMFGKEVCGIILIKDTAVSSKIEVDYQTVGGQYSLNSQAIVDMLNSSAFDNRPVNWGDIISKPDLFTAAAHFHDAGDIYGFEYVVTAIERLRSAILIGDSSSHDEIYRYIDTTFTLVNQHISQVESSLNAHKADLANPHQTTKAQVGLGNVDNFVTATQAQAEAGTLNNLFMTPLRTAQAITTQAVVPLNTHISNISNPHQTTKAQVGLGSVNNFDIATVSEAQAGTSNVKYMTPYLTAQAITTQAGALLTAHVNDSNNPHQTTKAQVGLGNVQNFPVATTAEAQAGVSNGVYMTPLRTAEEITALVGTAFTAHVNNLNNPHQTTKTQVGLSNVQNFPMATTAEAQAGASTVTYMSPARTAEEIAALVGNAFSAHVNNLNNPHSTTKAQVGLGNVDNFPTASQAQAQAGSDNGTFMTPLRTAQAIGVQAAVLVNAHAGRTDNPHTTTAAQVGLGSVNNFGLASTADAQSGSSHSLYMTPLRVREAISALGSPAWYQGWISAPGYNADTIGGSRSGFSYAYNAPYNGPLVCFDAGGYNLQLSSAYNGQGLGYRTRNQDANAWNGWKSLAHNDGSNVSGTWPINVTGSASSANTANTATTASYANVLNNIGNISNAAGMTNVGATMWSVYNGGQPTSYGNILSLTGGGGGQLLLGWSGSTGAHADNFIRSMRDTGGTWSPWARIMTDVNAGSVCLPLTGGTVTGGTSFNAAVTFNSDLTVNGNARTGGWWRSTGNTGWYNETYSGGIYMTQAGFVDGYNGVALRASDLYTTSDRRIKSEIEPIKNARRRLFDTVTGCTFIKNGIPGMGFIAQDCQVEFGVAVIETADELPDGSKILTVSYGSMEAPMLEAMKEQDVDIEHLKTVVAEQQKEINELKKLVQALIAK